MRILTQLAVVLGLTFLGEVISGILPFPFPGSVISMILLFLLLLGRVIKVQQLREICTFLTENMSFFFIPAGVGILENWDILSRDLLALLVIAVVSTLVTFAVTAYTVKAVMAWQERRHK